MTDQDNLEFNRGISYAHKWYSFEDGNYPKFGDKIIVKVVEIDDELSTPNKEIYKTVYDVGEIFNNSNIEFYCTWFDEWRLIEIVI